MEVDKKKQMVNFVVDKSIELGKDLYQIIAIAYAQLAYGSTDSEGSEFHQAIIQRCHELLDLQDARTIPTESPVVAYLSEAEINKMNQDEYDYLFGDFTPTDNIDL
jgi:hypothetical protein